MTEWVTRWIARGWKRKGGAPENLGLWKKLVVAAEPHQVDWRWVRGHAGDPRNEYANHLAVTAARTLEDSGGLVHSGFSDWLEARRETRGEYMDFLEDLPPS
jgi:ribonuclease HI